VKCETRHAECAEGKAVAAHPWWLWPNLLSLDAPLVALVWLAAFDRSTGAHLPVEDYVLLGLAVWTIYVADRLLDVRRVRDWSLAPARHRFYARHAAGFAAAATVAVLTGLTMAIATLPPYVWMSGAVIGGLAAIYLPRPGRLGLPKEFYIGVLFSLGTVCAAGKHLGPREGVAAGLFALLCMANCVTIGRREAVSDRVNDPSALCCRAPRLAARLNWLLGGLALAGLILGGGLGISISLAAAGMWILREVESRVPAELHRVLADVTLLSPLLVGGILYFRGGI